MRIIELSKETKQNILMDLLKRSPNNYSQYEATVNEIIERVKSQGDNALFDYSLKFDKFPLNSENIKVTREEIQEAYEKLDSGLIEVRGKHSGLSRQTTAKQLV